MYIYLFWFDNSLKELTIPLVRCDDELHKINATKIVDRPHNIDNQILKPV